MCGIFLFVFVILDHVSLTLCFDKSQNSHIGTVLFYLGTAVSICEEFGVNTLYIRKILGTSSVPTEKFSKPLDGQDVILAIHFKFEIKIPLNQLREEPVVAFFLPLFWSPTEGRAVEKC